MAADNYICRRSNYSTISGEQEYFITPLLRKAISDALNSLGRPKPAARALDVGAGECPLRDDLISRGFAYKSLDVSQNKTNSIDYVARIDDCLPEGILVEGGFDLILCTEVLEHVPDWGAAFSNIGNLLRRGGVCIISAPFFYMPHEEPHDYWRPMDHALRHFAEKFQFDVKRNIRIGDGWDVYGTLLCSMAVCRKRKSLIGWSAAVPTYIAHWLIKTIVKSRILSQSVELQTRFYLGNVFILEKAEQSNR